ncbi:trypsin-like peptidase domain-containing protein [Patescibacteria group bacterium]|nr:trypsin-like peptidase domain-containing protein [Patescibacteria group bacterium]MBU1921955.1 trypsin-like peptidase domain-containing protein [Patescibacteria group bacterium]
MSEEKKTSKTAKLIIITCFIAFVFGTIFGGAAGAVTGIFGQSHILPWLEQNIGLKILSQDLTDWVQTLQVEEESATIGVVEQASPAVVSIVISKDLSKYYSSTGPDIFPFDFFGFSWPSFWGSEGESGVQEIGGGTGFVVSSDGLILTNNHVVEDEEAEYTVVMNDGTSYKAEVVGQDAFLDLAIVKIEAENLPALELGDSDNLRIGQTVIAIGYALSEYQNTVTKGVISGINRRVEAADGYGRSEVIEEAIQTDAAINPGNSGGPLLDLSGQVIGVNTAVSREGQLVGFAIPINSAKKIVQSVREYGRIVRPWLGVRYVIITEPAAKENKLPVDYGALILRGSGELELAVVPGGPADKVGLQENDIILEVDGTRVDQDNALAKLIAAYSPGDTVKLKILHKGEEKEVDVVLEEYGE